MRLVFSQDNDHPNETTSEEEIFRTAFPMDFQAAEPAARVLEIYGQVSAGGGAARLRLYSSAGGVFDTGSNLDGLGTTSWMIVITQRLNAPSTLSFTAGDVYHTEAVSNFTVPHPSPSGDMPVWITAECGAVNKMNVFRAKWYLIDSDIFI